MHGLEFTGAEVQAISYAGTIGIDDDDGQFNYEDGKQPSPWQSHPLTIGYVRGNQSTGTTAGTAGMRWTAEKRRPDELARLSNTSGETELNPHPGEVARTARSEQQAAGVGGGGGGTGGGGAIFSNC